MRIVGGIFLALSVMATHAAPSQGQSYGRAYGPGQGPAPVAAGVDQAKIDEDEVVRVETTLVTVPVTVSDRDGKYVGSLQREDFRIFEDGVEQQLSFFSNTEKPLSVILLLDTSASTELYLDIIQGAASSFVEQMRPHDRVLPVSFDGRVRSLLPSATGDHLILRVAVGSMRTDTENSGTRLYDAVATALNSLRSVSGRKAVILFTDGEDTGSAATREKTLAMAAEVEALFYSVYLDTAKVYERPPEPNGEARVIRHGAPSAQYLQALAKKTGGRSYQAHNLDVLREAFAAIAQELRHQYHVGYYPKSPAGGRRHRQVTVRVRRPNVDVRGRKTFIFAPPDTK